MHYSAKRGLAIACRPSLCPSVCPSVMLVDCDQIGWELTLGTNCRDKISPTPSLFVTQKPSTYSQGDMGKFSAD